MSIKTVQAYRFRFERVAPQEAKRIQTHDNPTINEFLNLTRKQEALNLIPNKVVIWTADFKGATTRIYADQTDYYLEINQTHFDNLSEDQQAFVLLREIEKMRLGLVVPDTYTELTSFQEIFLDTHAATIVGANVARITLNKLALFSAKDINEANPRVSILNRQTYGFPNMKCPAWVVEDGLDYNFYIGAVTEVMADKAPEQNVKFYYNERLKDMNQRAGYKATPLDPVIHSGFDIGELSFMDLKI